MADDKVRPLFGTHVPTPRTTEIIQERARNAAKSVEERKMVAFAAVAIDDEGQAHMFFGHDPLRDTVLIGGVAILQRILIDTTTYADVTPKGTDPNEPAS